MSIRVSRIFSYSKMPSFAIPQKIIETLIDVNLQLYQHYGETMANLDKPPPAAVDSPIPPS